MTQQSVGIMHCPVALGHEKEEEEEVEEETTTTLRMHAAIKMFKLKKEREIERRRRSPNQQLFSGYGLLLSGLQNG